MGKRKAGEKIRQATDFKEARAAFLLLFKGQHGEEMFFGRRVPEVTRILGKANCISTHPKLGRSRTTALRRLLIGAGYMQLS